MNSKVLFVDDDINILNGFKRNLRSEFEITAVSSPGEALQLLEGGSEFAVVVADFKMPKMNGIEFLSLASAKWPELVRILLTGEVDTKAAIAAVNQGRVYRFLMKPLALSALSRILHDAVQQHGLIAAEKELLEKTLAGATSVLTEILGLLHPFAFSRTGRTRQLVSGLVTQLGLTNSWEFEVAAMLSLIGYVALPNDVLRKVCEGRALTPDESRAFRAHPITARLLAKIPRLEAIAGMIEQQEELLEVFPRGTSFSSADRVRVGSFLLKIANHYDSLTSRGLTKGAALEEIQSGEQAYPPDLLTALASLESLTMNRENRVVNFLELRPGMTAQTDIVASDGLLLLAKGNLITATLMECLSRYFHACGIREPIQVLLPT